MNHPKAAFLALVRLAAPIGLVVLLAVAALAQVSANHDLSWHVLASGGADTASAGHLVHGTLGQFAVGPASGLDHAAGSGYWYGVGRPHRIYLPIVLKSAIW
ncbi:MAG: hypothetical protein JXM73_24790 [Anaerolineae bacterium]|nr:hypothetical protein [Anaerolineae bacterium]